MDVVCARADAIEAPLYDALAQYRYQVFVERLGWELPSQPGYEQDEFDHAGTVHLMARHADGSMAGCGRLLPTSGRYLLESVFPQLLNGIPVPCSDQVWELSRFAAMDTASGAAPAYHHHMAERVLLQALRFCAARGVTHLLAVSTPPVERLLQRAGVECQRLGPPDLAGGKPVLALVIAVSARSIEALAVIEAAALQHEAPLRLPRAAAHDALQSLIALAHAGLAEPVSMVLEAGASDGRAETTLH